MALPSRSVYSEIHAASTIAVVDPDLHYLRNTKVGKKAVVETRFYGQQAGTIELVSRNHFYGDPSIRAFVVANKPGQFWAMWVRFDELDLIDKCDCGGEVQRSLTCPECGHCLGCCDCPPPMEEDDSDGHFFVTNAWGFSREVDPDAAWDERE